MDAILNRVSAPPIPCTVAAKVLRKAEPTRAAPLTRAYSAAARCESKMLGQGSIGGKPAKQDGGQAALKNIMPDLQFI